MPESTEKSMQERITRLEAVVEAVTEQYKGVMKKLDTIVDKLSDSAVASNEIVHLKEEQALQWKKIDEHKNKQERELKKVHTRIDLHMAGCAGPAGAMEVAEEAKKIAISASSSANSASAIPGKYAIAIVGSLLLLASNLGGGIILYFITRP